jgi:hypothetical protein
MDKIDLKTLVSELFGRLTVPLALRSNATDLLTFPPIQCKQISVHFNGFLLAAELGTVLRFVSFDSKNLCSSAANKKPLKCTVIFYSIDGTFFRISRWVQTRRLENETPDLAKSPYGREWYLSIG